MKVGIKKLFIFFLSLWLAGIAGAGLSERIEFITKQPSQNKTQFAIHIINADSGKTIFSYNETRAMIPASNMKIVTTAAAVKYLGPDFEYITRVGLCDDALVIIGSGDPLLGDEKTDVKYNRKPGWMLDDITEKIQKLGIKEINDIIIDTTVFDDRRVHPNWPEKDLNKRWACEVCGLNYNGNCIEMTVANNNGRAVVSIEPATSYVKFINKATTINKVKGAVGAYRLLGKENSLIVKGKCGKQKESFDVAIERPAGFFGQLLAERLLAAGIIARGQLIEKAIDTDCKFRKIAEYKTTIADCLERCNKNSFGLAAEALLKTIAAQSQSGKFGSWPAGRRLVSEYLLSLGIKAEEFNFDDASGLSRENKISPSAITRVLDDVYKSKNWQLYKQSLAAGGVDGTLSRYFKEDKYRGKIFGKTGYISGIRSFSGICITEKGDFVFSILTERGNNQTRKAINDIVKAIFE